jgi:hypothetical protein
LSTPESRTQTLPIQSKRTFRKLSIGLPISDWILRAEEHADSARPLSEGVTGILEDIARVEAGTYPD